MEEKDYSLIAYTTCYNKIYFISSRNLEIGKSTVKK
jgi:hypothetical protein